MTIITIHTPGMLRSHCRLFYTPLAVYFEVLNCVFTCILLGNVRTGPSLRMQLQQQQVVSSWWSALLCIENSEQLLHSLAGTVVSTDAHLSIRHIEFQSIMGVLRVYTLVLRVLSQWWVEGISLTAKPKEQPIMATMHLQYIPQNVSNASIISPNYCEYRHYLQYRNSKYSGVQAVQTYRIRNTARITILAVIAVSNNDIVLPVLVVRAVSDPDSQ